MPVYTFTHNGHRINYATEGDSGAPPVLFVHGLISHLGVWRQTIPALSGRYFCVAIDLLGFGGSDKPLAGDYSIEAQGKLVLAVADSLGIDRFAIVGHSMGGQIALAIASRLAPQRVTKLVSVAGVVNARLMPLVHYISRPQFALGYYAPFLTYPVGWLARFPWYARIQFRSWFRDMRSLPWDDWAVDRQMAMQEGIHVSAHRAMQAIYELNLTSHLKSIAVPVLAIFGRQDGTVPVSDGHLVEKHVPGSRLVLIDNCGHFPMYEQTAAYLEALLSFVDSP